MRRIRIGVVAAVLLWGAAVAQPQPQPPAGADGLPPAALAVAAIEQDPSVVQARHALQAAEHEATMLDASPHEWTVGATAQRRRVDGTPGASGEWSARIERTLRLGGKAQLDRALGEAGRDVARARLDAARRDVARALVDSWVERQAARAVQRLMQEQLEIAEANLRAAELRRRAGDASALEHDVARGDLAEVQRQASAAAVAASKAQAALELRHPPVAADERALGDPQPLAGDAAQWSERIRAAHPALRAAQGALRRAELKATRARADRTPDPTLGVYTSSEAWRSERIVGVSVSVPLGGRYRDAVAREALEQAEVARAAAQRERLDVDVQAAVDVREAQGSLQRWELSEQSAAIARDNARLAQRAYALGELDVQSLLIARRQSLEAAQSAVTARADALRAGYRLRVDARELWAAD